MSEGLKHFNLLCPYCKEVISFSVHEEDLKKRYKGGLAQINIAAHGNPPHILDVYIDKAGLIRGAYPQIQKVEVKTTLQNHYIVDATSEITPDEGKTIGVKVLPYAISIEDAPLRIYNEEIFFPEFYESLRTDKKVKNQTITVEALLDAFKNSPENKPIIALLVSKRYSETYTNATIAKMIMQKEDPKKAAKIFIIDSKTTGPMMKLMINEAIAMDEAGAKIDEIVEHLRWISKNHVSYIYVDSLDALRKSERLGKVTTFFGNLLGVKPIIIENENNNGDLKAFKTVKSKEEAISEITNAIKEQFENEELKGVIFYGIIIDYAKQLKDSLNKELQLKENDLTMDFIGTAVAIHLSYDVLGISIYSKRK